MPWSERKPLKEGDVFGNLTVIEYVGTVPYGKKGKTQPLVLCSCSCGSTTTIRKFSLTSGNTQSCGCLRVDLVVERSSTHGRSKDKVYLVWKTMIRRCHVKSSKGYPNYGARGISVCPAWRSSFETFILDMGERPEGHSLERLDNNGDYCPENCVWADRAQQSINRRKFKSNSSGHVGVYSNKSKNKWFAGIGAGGRFIRSELFDSFEDAVAKRKEYEMMYFGKMLTED
jgi:hypothetical protein